MGQILPNASIFSMYHKAPKPDRAKNKAKSFKDFMGDILTGYQVYDQTLGMTAISRQVALDSQQLAYDDQWLNSTTSGVEETKARKEVERSRGEEERLKWSKAADEAKRQYSWLQTPDGKKHQAQADMPMTPPEATQMEQGGGGGALGPAIEPTMTRTTQKEGETAWDNLERDTKAHLKAKEDAQKQRDEAQKQLEQAKAETAKANQAKQQAEAKLMASKGGGGGGTQLGGSGDGMESFAPSSHSRNPTLVHPPSTGMGVPPADFIEQMTAPRPERQPRFQTKVQAQNWAPRTPAERAWKDTEVERLAWSEPGSLAQAVTGSHQTEAVAIGQALNPPIVSNEEYAQKRLKLAGKYIDTMNKLKKSRGGVTESEISSKRSKAQSDDIEAHNRQFLIDAKAEGARKGVVNNIINRQNSADLAALFSGLVRAGGQEGKYLDKFINNTVNMELHAGNFNNAAQTYNRTFQAEQKAKAMLSSAKGKGLAWKESNLDALNDAQSLVNSATADREKAIGDAGKARSRYLASAVAAAEYKASSKLAGMKMSEFAEVHSDFANEWLTDRKALTKKIKALYKKHADNPAVMQVQAEKKAAVAKARVFIEGQWSEFALPGGSGE